ncbi:MAG: hypothetical protein J7L64_02250 [Acidobacteria bacterium]|nr:hypothetical protein [Acidobacteriota bacterium]
MRRRAILIGLIFLVFLLPACSKEKRKEKNPYGYSEKELSIINTRNQFKVEVTNCIIKREEGEILLNLHIVNNSRKKLNYLTLKLVQYDKDEKPIAEGRITVDVSDLDPGIGKTELLKYTPADPRAIGISVEVEQLPPKEKLSQYKEFM